MGPDEMRTVAEFASLAPSVHNTQPWRFVATTDALEIYADPDRGLGYLDPNGRQLHLSCGAVTEFSRLAIRSLGSVCTVQLLPSESDPTLLATLTVGPSEPTTPEEQRLIDAVPRRYTDRGPYSGEPVSDVVVRQIRQAATADGCWVRVLDRPGDRLAAITLLAAAEDAETHDPAYQAELGRWSRDAAARDGIPKHAYATWKDSHRTTDVPLRDFSGRNTHPHPSGEEPPPDVERDALVLLGSDRDDPASWLCAGRALAHMLLVLTEADLVSQPLGPVLDVPMTRARLRHVLGLVGYPQLMLRIGRGEGRPVTGRRSVSDTFSVVPS